MMVMVLVAQLKELEVHDNNITNCINYVSVVI